MDQPAQLISIPLDLGIDVSISEQGGGKGAVSMVNFDFAAEGDVAPRGAFERLEASGHVNVAPGLLLPQPTVPVHRRASIVPLEVSCIARAATSARLFAAQAVAQAQYTLMVVTCRDESTTAAASDDPNNYVDLTIYDSAGIVLSTSRFAPIAAIADVKISNLVSSGSTFRFYLSYAIPSANTLIGRLVTFVPTTGFITVGTGTTLFSSVDSGNWATSVHTTELLGSGLSLFVITTSGGTLRYRVVDGVTAVAAAAVNTALASTNYTEMASCHADGVITVATGHSEGATALGIYSFNDSTLGVSTHFHLFPTITLSRRLAVVPDDSVASTNVVVFVELTQGTDAVYCNAGIGVLGTMGEQQNIRLADAGTWIEEDDFTSDNGQRRVPLIGLTSSEAIKSNFRSHVVARVFFDAVTFEPRFSSAAIVAHSDAGSTYGRVEFSLPHTRVGPLPRYAFNGGPTVVLPVLVVSRTTADRTITADGGIDVFDRYVRLTTVTSNAHQHRGVVKLGPNTYVGGSVPSSWDGFNLSPAGFPLPPHTIKTSDAGVVAGLPDGTFGYKVRQYYQDQQGTIFESPVVYLATAIQVNIATHTPRLTLYPGVLWTNLFESQNTARFGTDIFRNPDTMESGDLTFHKAFTVSHGIVEAAQVFNDTRSAADIATGELLPDPTTGALTSGPLPALNHLWAHRSRLFGVDAFDQELIRFTTEYTAPTAPLWADELTLRVTNSGGPVIAGASLGDKLIALQENQISVSAGEGPDGTGLGAFSYPESLRGVGAMAGTQGAVVEVPSGLMFVHRTGIYHLGFDLALTFPGSKLTHKIGQLAPIKRAVYLASRAQVWFLTDGTSSGSVGSPHILVWDTTRSRWSTFSSSLGPFSDAIEVSGDVYLLDTRGRLLEAHSASSVVDIDEDGNPVGMDLSVGLPKVRANNAQKIRLRKIHISGQSEDIDVDIEVDVTTHNESRGDDSEETTKHYSFDLTNHAASFQLPLRAATQRCDSAQCVISVTNADPELTNGLKLSTLTYEISVLPGTGKAPVAKRPAVS